MAYTVTIEEENRFTQMSKYLSKAIELRVKFSDQDKNDLRLKSVLNKLRLPVSAVNEFGEIVAHNNAMVNFLQHQDERSWWVCKRTNYAAI